MRMSTGARKVVRKFAKKAVPKKSVQATVARLTKKVNAIAKVEKDHICKVMYSQGDSLSLGTATGAQPSQIIPLTNYSYWTRCFGTDADDEQAKKAVIRKSSTEYIIDASGELDTTGYSIFCVSLKKNASALLDTSGYLLGTFTNNVHYYGSGSRVLLNLNYFNVHYVKRHLTGDSAALRGGGTAGFPSLTNMPSGSALRFTGKINMSYNKGKGLAVQNPKGDWKAAGYPQDDAQNYFILCFADDSTLDAASPRILYNTVHVVDVVA